MLNNYDAIATVAVKNLQKARTFYEKALGLIAQPSDESMAAMVATQRGGSRLLVYVSQFAGQQATAATWA
jgi:catechol-2,3-dioxygenase